MNNQPFTFNLPFETALPDQFDHHVERHLSAMQGQFSDLLAYENKMAEENVLLYEVYEIKRPEKEGELLHGVSIVHPGRIGDEFYMTKGHFHTVVDTAEIYYCIKGKGKMVMETPEGDWAVSDLTSGTVLYVPPCWAHRSVNTSPNDKLITFFIYPANAGHDYGTIEKQGFRKLVVECSGEAVIVDNPRWTAPEVPE